MFSVSLKLSGILLEGGNTSLHTIPNLGVSKCGGKKQESLQIIVEPGLKAEVEATLNSQVGDEETTEENLGWILTVTVVDQVILSVQGFDVC